MLLAGMWLLALPGFCNVSSYSFTQSVGTYNEINGGTVQGDSTNDDGSFNAINLGFSFFFDGASYTKISVNSNGFIAFGNTVSSSYNAISGGTSNNVVAALNHDIEGQFGAELMTKRTGPAGNYVFVIQWKSYRSYDFPAIDGDDYNFQIRLHQASGKIEVVYGSFLKEATARAAEVGLRGASTADFNNRTSLTNWSASTAGAFATDAMTLDPTVLPATGLTYAWMPPPNDLALLGLISPVVPGCFGANETVTVQIKNTGSTTIDFTTNPVTVNGNVAITNPTTFPAVLINTGSLAGGATMDVVLSTSFNMTATGNYQFNASITPTGDPYPSNNTMTAVNANSSQTVGVASIGSDTICAGTYTDLVLTGSNGAVQWQSFDGASWVNEIGAGNNTTTYTITPSGNGQYRATVCNTLISNVVTVEVVSATDPVAADVSRCGEGSVTLSASGPGTHYWYDAPTGGAPLDSGNTYTTYLTNTTTFYASSVAGGTMVNVGPLYSGTTNNFANTGGHGIMITTTQPNVTITGADIPFTGTGTLTIALKDPTNTTVISSVVTGTVTGSGTTAAFVPFTLNIASPGNYLLIVNAVSGTVTNLGYLSGSVSYPYTSSVLNITSGYWWGADNTVCMYLFNLRISTGCESNRVPVVATINAAPTASATATSSTFCGGTTVTLNASSSNTGYDYTWSPATGLSGTAGASVSATPVTTTTYTLDANDSGTGCHFVTSTTLNVNPTPQTTVTATPASLCLGSQSQLQVSSAVPMPMDFNVVGTDILTNTNTGYPTPYASNYWGNRQQFLIPAAELAAAGLTAGPIHSIGFDVANTSNSMNLANFVLKVGNTNLNALTTFQTGLTQVYTNASYAPTTGWNMHNFSTPFIWNGVSNIIVETCFNNSSYVLSSNALVRQTATTYSSSINYNADVSTVCGTTTVNNIQNQRPNIRFGRQHVYQYAWTPTTSINTATVANPVAQPLVNTTYFVTVTDSNSACAHTDSVAVSVGTIVPSAAGAVTGTATLCQGSSATYSVGAVTNASSYSWVVPTGATITSGSTTNTIVVSYSNTAVSGDVVVTPINGCGNGPASAPLAITVNPLPAAAGTIVGLGNDTVCKGETGVTYSVPTIVGATSYFWTVPTGATITTGGSTNTITVTFSASAVSGNITVKGFNSCGFGATSTFPVAVYGTPSQAGVVHGPTSVCQGQSNVMFYVDPVAGATDYVWNVNLFGATIVGDATNDTVYVNIANNSTSGVIFVNGHSPCATGLASPSLSVLVNNAPSATITSSNSGFNICLNDSSQLGVTPACTGCTYAWTPGADLSDSTIANPYASPSTGTTYTVTVTSNGCSGTASQAFTVLPAATQATITMSNDTLYSSAATSYQWNLNGTPIAGATSSFYRFTANGVYTVTTTDANGCHSTSAPQNVNSTSIVDMGSYASLNVYPNPFTQSTQLSYVLSNSGRVRIELFNLLGERVKMIADEVQVSGVHNYTIDMQDELNSGVFILKVTTDKRSYFERLTFVK